MRKYVILRRLATKSGDLRGAPAGGGAETLGTSARPTVSAERLTDKGAVSMAAEPEVELVAPAMPTSLIRPLAAAAGEASDAWGIDAVGGTTSTFTGEGVTVAVLDTGIDPTHPAFAGVDLVQRDFSGDGDGERQGHGTHCAGTILGRDVSGKRIGVARGVERALIGKVLRDNGGGDSEMIFEGMQWALQQRANVISMSLGFDFPGMVESQIGEGWPTDLAVSNALEAYRGNLRMFDAIMQLTKAMGGLGGGALVVAAAGNESRREQHQQWRIAASLPAAASEVMSVAAVGRNGSAYSVATFSNSMAVVSGPGVDILSAWPGGGLHAISGTSMACPHVAGVAALWWEAIRKNGQAPTPTNVRAKIIATARSDKFEADADEADYGQGLVTAP